MNGKQFCFHLYTAHKTASLYLLCMKAGEQTGKVTIRRQKGLFSLFVRRNGVKYNK